MRDPTEAENAVALEVRRAYIAEGLVRLGSENGGVFNVYVSFFHEGADLLRGAAMEKAEGSGIRLQARAQSWLEQARYLGARVAAGKSTTCMNCLSPITDIANTALVEVGADLAAVKRRAIWSLCRGCAARPDIVKEIGVLLMTCMADGARLLPDIHDAAAGHA
jgi:hypothetical protein